MHESNFKKVLYLSIDSLLFLNTKRWLILPGSRHPCLTFRWCQATLWLTLSISKDFHANTLIYSTKRQSGSPPRFFLKREEMFVVVLRSKGSNNIDADLTRVQSTLLKGKQGCSIAQNYSRRGSSSLISALVPSLLLNSFKEDKQKHRY